MLFWIFRTIFFSLFPYDSIFWPSKGVNFMEKTISIRGSEITFSIWDLGGKVCYYRIWVILFQGQREFVNMLPLVCNDAVAILFMFDLSRKSTLNSVKEWYRQARGFNKVSLLFLQDYSIFSFRLQYRF
jgi:GTP-binding protein of the ras superfamily involved in termination of M-phase